jgi:hypothetical protein
MVGEGQQLKLECCCKDLNFISVFYTDEKDPHVLLSIHTITVPKFSNTS